MNKERWGILATAVSAAGFGTLGIFAKFAYDDGANAVTVLAIRFLTAAVLFWLLLWYKGINPRVSKRAMVFLLILGGIGYGSFSALYFLSVRLIPVSMVAMLLYAYPAIVFVLSVVLGDERASTRQLQALVLSFIGLVLVLGPSFQGLNLLGVGAILTAALIYSVYIVVNGRLLKGIPSMVAAAYISTSAALVFWGAGLFTQSISFGFTWVAWLASLLVAFFSTFVAISTFFFGISLIGPSRASIVSILEPVVTVGLSGLLFAEKLSGPQLIGGVFILGSIMWLQSGKGVGKGHIENDLNSSESMPKVY
ncbi:hypothetical protein SY88_02995 [Clostridiales bacterium PH28_bin88]|nr:hypothetical protein SY88_02995 [Clostridiales bacterium PH28_bin88]